MLSKSQAKGFFLFGTAVCSAIFIGLTIDTFQKIPTQTNESKMTSEVIRGKHLFDKNNCMGCHTILGEGAYYAPELTKVFERRGESFIKMMLKDPASMYPGQRQMINYHFSDQEISDLTAFLKWIGEMDLNGFPAKPDLATTSAVASAPVSRPPAVFSQMCLACHTLNAQGGKVGPALDGVGSRLDAEYIGKWLRDPQSLKPDAKMPKLPLSNEQISELAAFLAGLKGGP